MLSGTVLGPSGEGPRRRHPVATTIIVVLMMAVLFGATYGAVRLLKGTDSAAPSPTTSSPAPCVTTTVKASTVLPKPATVTVNVYNATNRAGLARRTSNDLKARGFVIGTIANDPLGKNLTNVGEIRYGPSGRDNALLMRYYVPGMKLVLDKRTDASIDVVLGQKYVAVAPQKKVNASLAKPVPVATGAGCATTGPVTATKPTASAAPSPTAS
ncbi:MAG: hypothetical protein GC157_15455 [Frankiales bacterium]|nr:hypothetical protein [Frankiales bacterium]